jgi:Histidine kinase-like ATPase domain
VNGRGLSLSRSHPAAGCEARRTGHLTWMGDVVYDVDLPVDPRSPGRARRLVQAAVGDRRARIGVEAALAVSELVTNAVRCTRSRLHLVVRLDARALRVEVGDDGEGVPAPAEAGPASVGGRGLTLVDCLVDRWGVSHGGEGKDGREGKTVWFEIALPGGPSQAVPTPSGH